MSCFDNIPAAPSMFAVAEDDSSVLSRWRETSARSWSHPTFVAALRVTVKVVRPLARGLSAVISGCDASRQIGAMLTTEHEVCGAVDSLATDLLASAVLLEALAGDAAAQFALDHFRPRRGLRQVAWRKLVRNSRGAIGDADAGPTRPAA